MTSPTSTLRTSKSTILLVSKHAATKAMTHIEIIQGDITTLSVDAIVNAANPTLHRGGGVCGAIHAAAGPELEAECRSYYEEHGRLPIGGAAITKGYNLPAKFVIHAVGPIYGQEDGAEAYLLEQAYLNSLKLAEEHNLRSIAFPAISTGTYGYPMDQAVEVVKETMEEWLQQKRPTCVERIVFVLFSDRDFEEYKNIF